MTVRELIRKLKKVDPRSEVYFDQDISIYKVNHVYEGEGTGVFLSDEESELRKVGFEEVE